MELRGERPVRGANPALEGRNVDIESRLVFLPLAALLSSLGHSTVHNHRATKDCCHLTFHEHVANPCTVLNKSARGQFGKGELQKGADSIRKLRIQGERGSGYSHLIGGLISNVLGRFESRSATLLSSFDKQYRIVRNACQADRLAIADGFRPFWLAICALRCTFESNRISRLGETVGHRIDGRMSRNFSSRDRLCTSRDWKARVIPNRDNTLWNKTDGIASATETGLRIVYRLA